MKIISTNADWQLGLADKLVYSALREGPISQREIERDTGLSRRAAIPTAISHLAEAGYIRQCPEHWNAGLWATTDNLTGINVDRQGQVCQYPYFKLPGSTPQASAVYSFIRSMGKAKMQVRFRYLALCLGLSRGSVRRAMHQLEAAGHLAIDGYLVSLPDSQQAETRPEDEQTALIRQMRDANIAPANVKKVIALYQKKDCADDFASIIDAKAEWARANPDSKYRDITGLLLSWLKKQPDKGELAEQPEWTPTIEDREIEINDCNGVMFLAAKMGMTKGELFAQHTNEQIKRMLFQYWAEVRRGGQARAGQDAVRTSTW